MTELKESGVLSDLAINQEAQDFLTSKYRTKFLPEFLPEFLIGNNKLAFYGQPLTMAKYSELMKSNLEPIVDGPA